MKILFLALALISSAFAAPNPVVVVETSLGTIEIELDPVKAPLSTKNFLDYVDAKFYDGLIFHRVINNFMIQGGGFDAKLKEKKTRGPVNSESDNGLKNDRGTIAMARTPDPNSATAQFFINVVNNDGLNRPQPDGFGYTVFGKVVSGMHVVDRIKVVKTGSMGGMENVPMDTVTIKSVRRKPAKP